MSNLGRKKILEHSEDDNGIYFTKYPNGAIAQKISTSCHVCLKKRERPVGEGVWTISYNGKQLSVCEAHKTNLDRAAEIEGILQYDPFFEWWK